MRRSSILGAIFCEIARAAGNVNPVLVEEKNINLVKNLRSMEPLFPIFLGRRGYKYKKLKVNGIKTEVFKPKKNASENVIFVCHGGAYVSRMMFYYRLLNKRYSKASGGGTVIHFDYRCAPEYTHPAMIEDCLTVWNWMLDQGYKAENTIVVGDSSGGNMALQLMLRLHDAGKPMPHGAVLYSPWSDMTASGDSYVYNYKVDPVFGVSPALTYYDDTYPPIFVTVGGDEVLKSECELLVKKFNEAGVEATLFAPPGMMHAFPIYELFPEAQQGLRMAFAFIREKFGVE